MKRNYLLIFLLLLPALLMSEPKREMRAAWVATVWALDWPATTSGSWVTDPARQQALLCQMLDSMKMMNMNCVALQGRTMSDAWYKSKYEPWSQWITGTRGGEPEYDPMAFAIQEAHKRGMELHVWINPYRYSSSETQFNTNKALANDYANTHADWLMTVGAATILNPGLEAVKQRICDVVEDLVSNYDVDGILFDDYFYLSGTPASMDADLYKANNPQGLSQEDWRREQVNEMVARVQQTILKTKPWVTFGIGPAPQVASNAAHAAKYGVPQGPFSDWQYNSIYSDPLAWMSRRTIDYISPQMYWHVGSSTCDFSLLSEWWSMIAERYGRHFYPSRSVEDSKASATVEEVNKLREDDRIGVTGSVLYSIRNGIYKNQGYTHYMLSNAWRTPALPPQKWWRRQETQLFVGNLRYESQNAICWNAPAQESNVRYAVYCLPKDSVGKPGQFYTGKYLLGMTYETRYPVKMQNGWTYAVSVVDRYGNEYAPVTFNTVFSSTKAAVLDYPQDGGNPLLPTYFTWEKVEGADSYFVEISADAAHKDVIGWHEVADNRFYTGKIHILEEGKTYYWRVLTRAADAEDRWSETRSFTGNCFTMEYPADSQKDVELTTELVCDSVAADDTEYTFEIATKSTFASSSIVFTQNSTVPRVRVAENVLASYTVYFVRCTVRYGGVVVMSDPTVFTTLRIPATKPVLLKPADGDTIVSTTVEVSWQEQSSRGFRVELSTHEGFAPRMTKSQTVDAYTYQATFTEVEAGNYFLRVRASDEGGYVDSDVINLTVQTPTGLNAFNNEKANRVEKVVVEGEILILMPDGESYDVLGRKRELSR